MRKIKRTVEELYKYCQENNIKMLSNCDADFWKVYRANSDYFDRLFCRTYKSFVAYGLVDTESDEEFCIEWIYDILAFLLANEKRYSELWRLQEIADVDYSILDNYNVRETHSTESSQNVVDEIGGRTDTKSNSTVYGQHTNSESNSYIHGAKSEEDTEEVEHGSQTKTTESEFNIGSQSNSSEDRISADNESTYSPKDLNLADIGSRTDSSEESERKSSYTDSKTGTHTEESRTDSESKSYTHGSHTDTDSATNIYGSHTNERESIESENRVVTKKGNMGIFSNSKLLSEHMELWQAFNFYKMIFDEIADEFLRIVYF